MLETLGQSKLEIQSISYRAGVCVGLEMKPKDKNNSC
jgi:hypothetical protein